MLVLCRRCFRLWCVVVMYVFLLLLRVELLVFFRAMKIFVFNLVGIQGEFHGAFHGVFHAFVGIRQWTVDERWRPAVGQ